MSVCHSEFIDALLDPQKPVPNGLASRNGGTAKRFAVYRNKFAVSLTEALEAQFPVIRKLVGDEFFKAMAGVYLRRHPPESPILSKFGNRMPEFLSDFEPVEHLPYLPDVARLETLIRESFYSKDSSSISNETLRSLRPADFLESRIIIAPSARTIQSRFPIFGIWRANARGEGNPTNRPEEALVARRQFDPELYLLPDGGCEFMRLLASGHRVSEAADLAAARRPDFKLDQILALVLSSGAATELEPIKHNSGERTLKCG
ncbi:MAG: DNA-binding domain-containing protein [Albidovulum sp.]|nr:DNA-binding domain-containing protein [Albidovulum sp.]MDE0306483.1 DNA-binding domain-containing protein [Albidovulum sp.]